MSSQLKVNAISDAAGANGNAITLATDGTCTAKITNNLSHRNLIINGAMAVNQRQSSAGLSDFNPVTSAMYTLDRWYFGNGSSFDTDSMRIKQVSDSPDEFSNSLRVDIGNSATPGAGQNGLILTKIEAQNLHHLAYGTSSAKSCTLSFWVRSNKTGTYCVQIQHRDADKYLMYEYSISSSNTWEKKTITFTGNTAAAITGSNQSDNGEGLNILWHLACHSDDHVAATTSWAANNSGKYYATSNQVNLWDHVDNVWYLTAVQLEVGSVATDFEHRSYGDELARCQRYFYKASGYNSHAMFSRGSTAIGATVNTPVPMRASPTAGSGHWCRVMKATTTDDYGDSSTGSFTVGGSAPSVTATGSSVFLQYGSMSNVTNTANTGYGYLTNPIEFEAEL